MRLQVFSWENKFQSKCDVCVLKENRKKKNQNICKIKVIDHYKVKYN